MFGEGIFTQDGESWKHSRDLLRPQFSQRKYESLDVFRESMTDLLEVLPDSGIVDLQPLFFRFTLDITTSFLFGESTKSLRFPSTAGETTFASAFDTAQKCVAKRSRLLDLYWLIGGREFRQACQQVHEFADRIIDRNLSSDGPPERTRDIFLHCLHKDIANRAALRGQIVNILTAGRDTTACLLSWTL